MKDKIIQLNNLLLKASLLDKNDKDKLDFFSQNIEQLYGEILLEISSDYHLINKNVWELINMTDSYQLSEMFIRNLYSKTYYKLLDSHQIKTVSDPIKPPYEYNKLYPYIIKLTEPIVKNSPFRLSEKYLNLKKYDKTLLKDIYKALITQSNSTINLNNLDDSMVNIVGLFYVLARNICLEINLLENFYLNVSNYIDYLNKNEHKQIARDTANELLYASSKDHILEYGCYIFFRNYSGQQRTGAALIFGTISLLIISKKGKSINKDLLFNITWETLKLLVNTGKVSFALNFYNNISSELKKKPNNRHRFDYSYFKCLFLINDSRLPSLLFKYLEENNHELYKDDLLPWLTLIYQIDSSSRFDEDPTNMDLVKLLEYKDIMESKLSVNQYDKQKTIIYNEIISLKEYYYESFMRVKEGRNKEDFVYDVKSVLELASRLIMTSFKNKDFQGFIMAMTTKSDYSLNQKNKTTNEHSQVFINSYKLGSDDFKEIPKFLRRYIRDDDAVIALAQADLNIYEMELKSAETNFYKLESWDLITARDWFKSMLPTLAFDDTIKIVNKYTEKAEVRQLLPEEHKQYGERLKDTLKFAQIYNSNKGNILLIKDLYLSQFPHNLLINSNNEYLGLRNSITDIISVEWFLEKCQKSEYLQSNYSIGIWIPTEAGDSTLSRLHDRIINSGIQNEYNVSINNTVDAEFSMNYNINIIAAHGDNSISNIPVLLVNHDTAVMFSDSFLEVGTILILLVCHSGSMKQSQMKSQIDSFVRKYLFQGYQCVIAPFWALNIDIPPIWLTEFLSGLRDKFTVAEAVFFANCKVYDYYPTPNAWACMHLYGNPYYKIS